MKNNQFSAKNNPFLQHQAIQKVLGSCPLCNFKYKNIQAKIIDENNEAQLMYVRCENCGGAVMLAIISSGPLVSSIGLITDLNIDDIHKFKNETPLEEEHVLGVHQILKTKNFCYNFKNQ